MPKYNLDERTLVYPAIAPASTALTGVYSSAIDTLNYSGALVIVNAGLAATSAELDVTVREGSARTVTTTHTHVAGASFTQIVPANDFVDAHCGVVDDHGELIGRHLVGAPDDEVPGRPALVVPSAVHQVLEAGRCFWIDAEAPGMSCTAVDAGSRLLTTQPQTGSRVAQLFTGSLGSAGRSGDVLAGHG